MLWFDFETNSYRGRSTSSLGHADFESKTEDMLGGYLKKKHTINPRKGKWKEFNKEAILIAEGHYENDMKQGPWIQYYETGELLIEEVYHQGILHGRYVSYHMNGAIMSEGPYINGRREGVFNIYDEDGKEIRSLLFVNNILIETVDKKEQLKRAIHVQ